MSCVWMLQRGHSGDGCVLASTLCKYDLRKGDLFVLSWARVRRLRQGSLSSELIMCGGGVRSILLFPLVARVNRCMYMAHVCFYVCCSDSVGVCGNVCCVAAVVKNNVFLSRGVLKYVVCLCRGCDGCCVFCLYCEAWSCRCSCMGSVSVSSCRCTEMLWMCLLYVSFGSEVRPRTFGCVAMGTALLFIVRSRLLVYSVGSAVNRVQVVLSGFSKRLFCFVQANNFM